MRGRTNAEPNIGVQLNASVDTYEVATGETILAGDFVEQNSYIEGQITAGSGSTNQYPIYECWDNKKPIRLSNDKFIYDFDIISKNNQGEYIKEGQVNNKMGGIPLGNDTTVVFSLSGKISLSALFTKYDSTNNTTQKRTETTVIRQYTDVSNTEYTAGYVFSYAPTSTGGYKGGAIVQQYNSMSNKTFIYLHLFDFNITGDNYSNYSISVSNVKVQQVTEVAGRLSYSSNTYGVISLIRLYSSENYAVTWSYKESTRYGGIMRFTDEFSNSFALSQFGNYSNTFFGKNVYTNGMVEVFTYSNNAIIRQRKFIPETGSDITSYTTEEITVNSSQKYLKYVDSISGYDVYFLIWKDADNNNIYINAITINQSTYEMIVYEAIQAGTNASLWVSSIDNTQIFLTIGGTMFDCNYANGVISNNAETVKVVRKITSQKYIKGVAKQSGNAGDTIEVYVPSTSY